MKKYNVKLSDGQEMTVLSPHEVEGVAETVKLKLGNHDHKIKEGDKEWQSILKMTTKNH